MNRIPSFTISDTSLVTGKIALGCMRIGHLSEQELYELIRTALDLGINLFDHADIYGDGACEELFGRVLKAHPELRPGMIIQTKCDIVTAGQDGPRYDTAREYILAAARNSVEKLACGYLDILLLHRPDPLMDPREVAEAFDMLLQEGTVRHFGVSNFPASKMRMLQKFVHQPLCIDQIQMSVVHAPAVLEDVWFNMMDDNGVSRTDHILDHALEKDLVLQAWCPLQASWEEGTFLDHPDYEKLNEVLQKTANRHHVSKAAASAAWLLRLPQKVQVIAGTTDPDHLRDLCSGAQIKLTPQEWYDILLAAHPRLP